MSKLIKVIRLLLLGAAGALFAPVTSAQVSNLYPVPMTIKNGIVMVTTSYGDTGTSLPIIFLNENFSLAMAELPIESYAPFLEVMWSPDNDRMKIIVGRNKIASSSGSGTATGCRLFNIEFSSQISAQFEDINSDHCDELIALQDLSVPNRHSLGWISTKTRSAIWSGFSFIGGQAGNYVVISNKLNEVARIYVYPNGAILLRNDGFFDQVGFVADRLRIKGNGISASIAQFYEVFFRPDIIRAMFLGDENYVLKASNELTVAQALRSPPPKVELDIVKRKSNSKRVNISYLIRPEAGGVSEVRIFQNGKLIFSDGTYKDAPGKAQIQVFSIRNDSVPLSNRIVDGRNAHASEATGGNALDQANRFENQLIVRGALEKKCTLGVAKDPCRGTIEVDVIAGEENTITVVAFNRDHTIQSAPASVNFRSSLPKEEPHLWLLGVGIDQFSDISSLKNARKDAQDFACAYAGKNALKKINVTCNVEGKASTIFKTENIHVVDALFDQAATKANILSGLAQVASHANPGDTFIWFVASHGIMDTNSLFGIVVHDTKCLNTVCTEVTGHITSNEILDASKKIKAMKQLVVLDTCYSGGLDAKLSGLYDARVRLLAKNMGLHLYASAQATELAQDGNPGTNGTFTAQLLEGIKGAAPKNSNGQISVMTLGAYAKQKTIKATTKIGSKESSVAQTPVIQHFGQDVGLAGGEK